MGNPIRLRIDITDGYYMELDVSKSDCNREEAHWHLCKHGNRIGQISYYGSWTKKPSEANSYIIREAEELTSQNSSDILNYYNHNKKNGAD